MQQSITVLKKAFVIITTFILSVTLLMAQPFSAEIKAFKAQDNISFPPKNAILFIGSSSFTKWKDVQSYFPEATIINRGFGGSILPDVIRYVNDIVFPYQPKQIIIYCGENDFAANDTVTVNTVVQRFEQLYYLIRTKLNKVQIDFVSIKPSPSRRKYWDKMKEANRQINIFLLAQKNAGFINVYDAMMLPNGQTNGALFGPDSLHMNPKGYVLWKKIIKPFLVKTN